MIEKRRATPKKRRYKQSNMPKRKWGYSKKKHTKPAGYEYLEATLHALDSELREAMNSTHQGKTKRESLWPIHQINRQRSRYVYNMYYKYKKISKELYDYLLKEKVADADLIAKWKKPGYENLCSTFVIDKRNFPFGSTAICRVPRQNLNGKKIFEANTGCRGCASGRAGYKNVFGNKYGQNLAEIQLLREKKLSVEENGDDNNNIWGTFGDDGGDNNDKEEEEEHVDNAEDDESSKNKKIKLSD